MTRLDKAIGSPAAAGLIFLVSLAILLLGMDLRLGIYDEGIILTGASRVMEGAVPHRDFYANYGPAQFYTVAGLFHLFGPSFLIARFYDLLVRAAIVAILFRLVAGRSRPLTALAIATICGLWMLGTRLYLYPVFPALLLALIGTQLLLPVSEGRLSAARLAGAGAMTGLCALFRYEVGFFLLAAHGVALVWLALRRSDPARRNLAEALRQALLYGAGTAAIFLPPALLLLSAGAGPGFVHDILEFPQQYYVRMRSLPFPGPAAIRAFPTDAAVYLPFAALALAAIALAGDIARRKAGAHHAFLLLFGLLTLALAVKGLVRISAAHMLIAIIPSLVLMAILADRPESRFPARAAAWFLAFLAFFTGGYQVAGMAKGFAADPGRSFAGSALGLEARTPATVSAGAALPNIARARLLPEEACAAQMVAAFTGPEDRIFVGTMRHDKLFVNKIELYFATGRGPGTHWYHFDPGLQTSAEVQGEMIADLQANRVNWVVRDSTWDDVAEPNESARSSGVTLLDLYLADRYRPVGAFGPISVWRANALPEPAGLRTWRCPLPGASPSPAPR